MSERSPLNKLRGARTVIAMVIALAIAVPCSADGIPQDAPNEPLRRELPCPGAIFGGIEG